MNYTCLVCGYPGLYEPPYSQDGIGSYEICPCCGFQYSVDDFDFKDKESAHAAWRRHWINGGYKWFSRKRIPPLDWDVNAQLKKLNQ